MKEETQNKKRNYMVPGKTNKEDRLNFIKFWADYIKTHADTNWSKQQNILINSQIVNARKFAKRNLGKD